MSGKPKSKWSEEALAVFNAKKALKNTPPVDPLSIPPPEAPKPVPPPAQEAAPVTSPTGTPPPVEGEDIRKKQEAEKKDKKKKGIDYSEIEASVPGLVKVSVMGMQVPIRAVCAMPGFPYTAKFRELSDAEAASAAAAMKPALKEILPTLFEDHPWATVMLIMSSCMIGTCQFERKPEVPKPAPHVDANNAVQPQPVQPSAPVIN